ncbi:MAG: hypothetical protein KF734_16250 [Saprospiraceae bacterium]|nr:hypothetical protein [Saprospiraceae bacterium]
MKFAIFSVLCLFLFLSPRAVSQNIISGAVNDYTPVLAIIGCDESTLQVGSSSAFLPNDKVLIIQMQGAVVNLSNTNVFGSILNTGNAGNCELNRIKSISGNQISLLYRLERDYDVNGKVQLVRVPEYGNITANGLTCKPWDGTTGGVLIVEASGTLTLQAGADVTGRGFRGGKMVNANGGASHETQYYYPPDPYRSAEKGEGIAIIPLEYSYGRGKAANGGGGGNGHNGGGGGGGNGGVGGNGGLEYWYAPGAPTLGTDGVGGLKVFESDVQRVVMGGGGGAGHTNDNVGSSGGNGGGIIILRAKEIVTSGGAAVLSANGADVLKFGNNNNDGQGGGGAGGTILIEAEAVNGTLYCDLKGGRGGDCLFYVTVQIIGAGGGGGGGKLMLSQGFPNVSANLVGGANGMANQNQTNGAQPGQQGVLLTGASIMEGTVPIGIQMISQSLTLCPNSSITLNGKTFDQPGVFMDTLAGLVGCDTIITYHVQFAPYDVVFDIEDVFCVDGKQRLRYSLCNRGASDWPDEIEVAFYDADPTKGALTSWAC